MGVPPDPTAPAWLPSPRTTLFSDRLGNTRAAYVQLRTGKVTRVEQPDLDYPVFLYVGADDLPVGIKFTAPVAGEIRSRIESFLRAEPAPSGPVAADRVERRVTCSLRPLPPPLVGPVLRQVEQASRSLERVTA